MLKLRLITAALLIILTIAGILVLPLSVFRIIAAAIILFAAWEWSILIDCKTFLHRTLYVLFIAAILWSSWYAPIIPILIASLIWWIIAAGLIITYPKSTKLFSQGIYARALMGVFTLVPCWLSLTFIRAAENGIIILIFILCIVWGADIGAYFSGKWWGKHKLAPKVSPNKTWQGLCGGILLAIIVAVIGCIVFNISPLAWLTVIMLSILTALFSIIGDLLESMLKRHMNIKDIGGYLPGHGGLLDRIDSLTAALPIFSLGLYMWKLFGKM
ncbi:MAG: CDP-archaeol synthase [Gammaproteobacteria bacterium]|jgi:phosphatidate cytidylyltransferase